MRRMKSTARRQKTVATISSSSEEDVSLDADHGEESTPTYDAASSSAVSQRRSGAFTAGEIWTAYIEHVTSERFSRRS
jgi:hypothetical protein